MNKPAKRRATIYLDPKIYEKAKIEAVKMGVSLSLLIEEILAGRNIK